MQHGGCDKPSKFPRLHPPKDHSPTVQPSHDPLSYDSFKAAAPGPVAGRAPITTMNPSPVPGNTDIDALKPPPPTLGQRVGRYRWKICALLFFATTINYVDRQVLGILAPYLQKVIGWNEAQYGYIVTAFQFAYALGLLVSGGIIDRVGTRLGYSVSVVIWSLSSMAHSLVHTPFGFGVVRFFLGIGESGNFPSAIKTVSEWFPKKERATAIGIFNSGSNIGAVVAPIAVPWIALHMGWRWAFLLTGLADFTWLGFWLATYRRPEKQPRLSKEELAYIRRTDQEGQIHTGTGQGAPLRYLITQPKVLGLVAGFFAYNYCFYLFLTWLPSYFSAMHMNLEHSIVFTSVPWLFATFTDLLVGGWLVDWLIRRGHDQNRVRKTVLIGGTVLGLAVAGAMFTDSPTVAAFWISISLGGLSAAAPVGWSLPSLIAPKDSVGKVGGILNFGNQLAGIIAPVATGYFAGPTNSFSRAFAAAAIILLFGIAGYVFLLGRVEPVPEP